MHQQVGAAQDAEGPAGVVDDRGGAEAAVGQQREGLLHGGAGVDGDRVGVIRSSAVAASRTICGGAFVRTVMTISFSVRGQGQEAGVALWSNRGMGVCCKTRSATLPS